jgi:hypothetical protein
VFFTDLADLPNFEFHLLNNGSNSLYVAEINYSFQHTGNSTTAISSLDMPFPPPSLFIETNHPDLYARAQDKGANWHNGLVGPTTNFDWTIPYYIHQIQQSRYIFEQGILTAAGFDRGLAWAIVFDYGDKYPYYYYAGDYVVLSQRNLYLLENGFMGDMPYYTALIEKDMLLIELDREALIYRVYGASHYNRDDNLVLALYRGFGSVGRGEAVYYNGHCLNDALFFGEGGGDFKRWNDYEYFLEHGVGGGGTNWPSPPPHDPSTSPGPSPKSDLELEVDERSRGWDRQSVNDLGGMVGPIDIGEDGTNAILLMGAVISNIFALRGISIGLVIVVTAAVIAGVMSRGKR